MPYDTEESGAAPSQGFALFPHCLPSGRLTSQGDGGQALALLQFQGLGWRGHIKKQCPGTGEGRGGRRGRVGGRLTNCFLQISVLAGTEREIKAVGKKEGQGLLPPSPWDLRKRRCTWPSESKGSSTARQAQRTTGDH
jgi:hypothetical protein